MKNKVNLVILFIWVLVVFVTAFNHEIWRDEAQVWCIVRDLNFVDAFNTARIEGHPFLWYLFVMPFAKMGLPVETMQIIGGLFVFASVILLVCKAPFNYFEKAIMVFSAGMTYYLPVIVRNYALIPLLVFLLAYLYNKKTEKPLFYSFLIILLSHTHLYMLGFCGVLFLVFVYDLFKENKKAVLLPFILCSLNFLIILLLFNNTQNGNYALEAGVREVLPVGTVLSLISKILFYNLAKFFDFTIKYFDSLSLLLFYPAFLCFGVGLFKNNKKALFVFSFSAGFILFVFTQVYFNGILYQKIFLIFVIMIFCFWICENKNKLVLYSFYSLFVLSMLVSPFVVLDDIKHNFSGSKQITKYVRENLKEEKIFIAVGNPFLFSTVSAYLPNKKFYSVISENYVTYSTYKSVQEKVQQPFPSDVDYNIVVENSDLNSNPYFDFIFETDNKNLSSKTEREVFKIYKRKKL